MSITDGQDVNAAVSNPSWISKNTDDTTPSRLGLGSVISAQGPAITWAQQQFNSICSFTGLAINGVYNLLPAWTNNYVGSSTNTVFARVQALVALFSGSTGHEHSGTDGDGPQIVASTIAQVPYRGYGVQGTNYTSTAASSDNVTSLLTGLPVSTAPTVVGVISFTPYNKTLLRNSATGDDIKDALGNTVYGRLTFATSVWTHSYYSVISGTETAYTFLATTPIEWYFQQIFNPMINPPTYDPGFIIPSANATADVLTATTTIQGKVSLSATVPPATGTGSAGTANGSVANADHTHSSGVVALTPLTSGSTLSVNGGTYTGNVSGGGFTSVLPTAASCANGTVIESKNISIGSANLWAIDLATNTDSLEGTVNGTDSLAGGDYRKYKTDGVSNWWAFSN